MGEEESGVDGIDLTNLGTWSNKPPIDTPSGPNLSPGMSRRKFLETGAKAAGAIVVSAIPGSSALENLANSIDAQRNANEVKEASEFVPRVAFIDLGNLDRQAIMAAVLGDGDRSQDLHLESREYTEMWSNYLRSPDPTVVRTVMLDRILKEKEGHGEAVVDAYNKTLSVNDIFYEGEHAVLPLEKAISVVFVDGEENPLNNPVARVHVSGRVVGDMLEEQFRKNPEQRIVNMSFQVGVQEERYVLRQPKEMPTFEILEGEDGEIYYSLEPAEGYANFGGKLLPFKMVGGIQTPLGLVSEHDYQQLNERYKERSIDEFTRNGYSDGIEDLETPMRHTTEAYNERFAEQNLRELAELCDRFPDKLFFGAGGNINSNFREIRQRMEENGEWPDNLILSAGVLNSSQGGTTQSNGSDIYINSLDFGGVVYSSISSPTSAGVADTILESSGDLTPEQIRDLMLRSASPYTTDGYYYYRPQGSPRSQEPIPCRILNKQYFNP